MPLIQWDLGVDDVEPTLNFQNLIELLFISLFRAQGVFLQTIRVAASKATEQFHAAHPFAVKRFDTDGKQIFATLEQTDVVRVPHAKLLQDLNLSQMVMDVLARPFFKKLEYHNFDAMRYWPLGQDKSVVLDPRRAFGKPLDVDSGVPTLVLFQMARNGETLDRIAKWYGVREKAVFEAIQFGSSLLKAA